nr:glutamate ABC transporter substrate-binding protein [uncultured Lactobacillus sp.]
MKKKNFLLTFLIVLIAITLSACGQKKNENVYQKVEQTKTINWGVKADTPLFGSMSIKDGKIRGFEIDLANALTHKMLGKNAKANFVTTTANTKIQLLKNKNIDAVIAAMTITPERKKQVDFSKPYFPAGQSIMVAKNSPIHTVKDLNNKKVLVVKGTTAADAIKKFAPKAEILQFDDYGQAFAALKAEQGDAFVTDNGILAGILHDNSGYKLTGGTFTNQPYGIAVNKGQKQMLDHINTALNELEKDGTYNRLVQKWFGNIPGFDTKKIDKN